MDAESNGGVARACEALERAMRRLTHEIATVRKPPVRARDDDARRACSTSGEAEDAEDDDEDDVDSIDALTTALVARTAWGIGVDDAPASSSAAVRLDEASRLGRRRRRQPSRRKPGEEGDVGKDKDGVIRSLKIRCERLESTVWTLKDALEATRRDVGSSSADEVAREVLAKEVTTLRRRLTAVNADRERLIELSNELRAALVRRTQSETTTSSSSSDEARRTASMGAAPRVVVEATPVVVVTRRDGDAGATTMAPSSSERETESQKIRLKRAIMRAKERRAAPRVRNWNDVSRTKW
jgi:hypothetical protein